jgi:hypothetical protein
MGGSDNPSNLKKVTVEQHAEEHRLLWEEYNKQEDYIAWKALSGQISSAEARIMAVKSSNTGRKQTKEHLEKRMEAIAKHRAKHGHSTLGKKLGPASEERKLKISKANKNNQYALGTKRTEESKKKQSEAAIKREILECPKCGAKMQKANLSRYHGLSGEKCNKS